MKVLFVCLGNAYRSPLAEALLKKLKPQIEVDSAGINPATKISKAAKRDSARENAQKHLKHSPEDIDEKELDSYNLIVVMEPKYKEVILNKCPQCADKIVVWNINDPYFLPHEYAEKAFTQLKAKVVEPVNQL